MPTDSVKTAFEMYGYTDDTIFGTFQSKTEVTLYEGTPQERVIQAEHYTVGTDQFMANPDFSALNIMGSLEVLEKDRSRKYVEGLEKDREIRRLTEIIQKGTPVGDLIAQYRALLKDPATMDPMRSQLLDDLPKLLFGFEIGDIVRDQADEYYEIGEMNYNNERARFEIRGYRYTDWMIRKKSTRLSNLEFLQLAPTV